MFLMATDSPSPQPLLGFVQKRKHSTGRTDPAMIPEGWGLLGHSGPFPEVSKVKTLSVLTIKHTTEFPAYVVCHRCEHLLGLT